MAALNVSRKVCSIILVTGLSFTFMLIGQGCGEGGGGGVPFDPDSALVEQLRTEYSTWSANTVPPFNAFTNYENSRYYEFWDGGHIWPGNGKALNTSDETYLSIAIIRYYAEMDMKADLVLDKYYDLDSTRSETVPISSAYRNPSRNAEKSTNRNSYHIYGQAIDFDTYGLEQAQLVWDAASSTNPIQLLNAAQGREYLTTRPSDSDNPIAGWIHVAW